MGIFMGWYGFTCSVQTATQRPDAQLIQLNHFQHPQVGISLLMAGNDFLEWQWLYQRRYARKERLRDSEQSPVSWIISEQSTALAEALTVLGLNPILLAIVRYPTPLRLRRTISAFCSVVSRILLIHTNVKNHRHKVASGRILHTRWWALDVHGPVVGRL
jgi:hypothetical protein